VAQELQRARRDPAEPGQRQPGAAQRGDPHQEPGPVPHGEKARHAGEHDDPDHRQQHLVRAGDEQREDPGPDHPAGDRPDEERAEPEDQRHQDPGGDRAPDPDQDGRRGVRIEHAGDQPAEREAGSEHRQVQRADPEEAQHEPDHDAHHAGHQAMVGRSGARRLTPQG
jgi:hypothetical protein